MLTWFKGESLYLCVRSYDTPPPLPLFGEQCFLMHSKANSSQDDGKQGNDAGM